MTADVGTVPRKPTRLSRGEWINVFKRTFSQFMADDCMGLAQQVAYVRREPFVLEREARQVHR